MYYAHLLAFIQQVFQVIPRMAVINVINVINACHVSSKYNQEGSAMGKPMLNSKLQAYKLYNMYLRTIRVLSSIVL